MTLPGRPPAGRPAAAPVVDPLAHLLDLPGVADAADAARDAVDRLLGHRVLRRESAGVSAESALRGARASAALAGVDLPLAQLRGADVADLAGLGAVADPVVQGALRVSVVLGSMVDTWSRAPGQVLARLHVLAATDLAPPEHLGRPQAPAGPRLGGLVALVTGPTTLPAVLVAAIVHGELAAVAPFGSGDGVVARAAGRLTGIARGLDPKAVSVPEVGFAELGRSVYERGVAGYASGTADAVTDWLLLCCRATELGALEGRAVCESLLRG